MPQELTAQEQFDAFAADVARELGTHCRKAPLPAEPRDTARLIVDDDGRALRLVQPDHRSPERLRIYAALPDESEVSAPSIGVTASSARHVAREIVRRLYPLHAEAAQQAAEITARRRAEERARRAVAEAVAGALPGARVQEQHRRTLIVWQHNTRPQGKRGPVHVDSVCAVVRACGESVQVDVAGRPDAVVPMPAAFARAHERS
ncbi:hypothetical protein AB0D47_36415 [Streptomyces sp. NPDC048376]|uniref:hypothetical protein n=1 Tax=Streptomyces sp. NPDC048376 TaxID=3154926 RepID=UPI0034397641